MARLAKAGTYSVVETNHVSAVRTGNIKAQYPMEAGLEALENGMIITVNDAAKTIGIAGATDTIYLHASEERIYEDHLGRNSFVLTRPNYPRALKLEEGDIFETNAVSYAGGSGTAAEALTAAKLLKAGEVDVNGDIKLAAAGRFSVVEWVTLPNGEPGVKFAVKTVTAI